MARAVTSYIANVFGSDTFSDCRVVFCLARDDDMDGASSAIEEAEAEPATPAKSDPRVAPSLSKQQAPAVPPTAAGGGVEADPVTAAAGCPQSAPGEGAQTCTATPLGAIAQPRAPAPPLGDPLPAHRVVILGGSARLRAQAERWTAEQQAGGSKPELRVPLGSPEDLPHALSALRFLYTGKVEGSSAAQLLQVRHQAAYLLVEGGVEACDAALLARVSGEAQPQQAGGAASRSPPPLAPVAELFACRHLLPEPAESGGEFFIAALLRASREMLVQHSGGAAAVGAAGQSASLGELLAWAFRDVPSLLCDPDTQRQMEALPAAAMEALLSCDSFATDDEATVLLVLATWRMANKAAFAPACDKLCRLVRLSQLSEDYLFGTLPFIPWFPLSREEHAFLCQYVMAAERPTKRTRWAEEAVGKYDTTSPWYSGVARPCGRSDLNRPYEWHIKQEDLAKELAAQTSAVIKVYGSFANGAPTLVSLGFEWRPSIDWKATDEAAGMYLRCSLPAALAVPTSIKPTILASTSAHLVVHRWAGEGGGRREEAHEMQYLPKVDYVRPGQGWGMASALPLAKAQAAGVEGGEGSAPLHRWGAYLREGKLTGSLDFT